jgi:hypothetical protein
MDELLDVWTIYLSRRQAEGARADAEANGDSVGVQDAERALAALPDVSALDALRANGELVNRLNVQRFIAMKDARDQGASHEQIGKELGVSRQSAWEFMQRKIAEHQRRAAFDAETALLAEAAAPAGDEERWEALRRTIAERRERG